MRELKMQSLILLLILLHMNKGNSLPDLAEALPLPTPSAQNTSLEYMDPTLPPLLPAQNPKCSLLVLQHDFAHTVGAPPATAGYAPPPDCQAPWSSVVLELSASASDIQKDRIAAVWLDGAEILRTTTPLPMSPGVFWRVRKDVTRYTALLRGSCTSGGDCGYGDGGSVLSMMLENSNATFPGVYSVNVSLHFYRGAVRREAPAPPSKLQLPIESALSARPIAKGLYREPADMIIPISNIDDGNNCAGFWFRVENETEVQTRSVLLPNNTYRAVLEVYVSHHGGDEYWYSNPFRSGGVPLDRCVAGTGLASAIANGGFRQVVATIDGRYVGSAVPFPVIYPRSVNPYFWAPVAAIGAYDHPSYDFDLTPFVGTLVNGQPHEFGLTVRDSQPYWLVSANLHVWLDKWSDEVEGALVRYKVPPFRLNRKADWKGEDGKSEVEGEVIIRFSGWVSSSLGNVTTSVRHRIKFKSNVEVAEKGSVKEVDLESKSLTTIRIERDDVVVGRVLVETEAPLQMETVSSNGGNESRLHRTKLHHVMEERRSMTMGKEPERFRIVTDRQVSKGSVLARDGVVLRGSGDTKSIYKFRANKVCYLRTVNMVGGKVKEDEQTASCSATA